MYLDLATRLCASEVVPNAGAAPGGIGAYSAANAIDLSGVTQTLRSYVDLGGGKPLQLNINVTTTVTSGTFASTLELQFVSLPINASLLTNATTSGKTLTITLVAVTSASTGIFTIANHGLPLGTPIHLTTIVTTTGISTGTVYYVVPQSANTFAVATSLANALAGTLVATGGGAGTATVNFLPTVHASTGGLIKDVFVANTRLAVPMQALSAPIGTSSLAGSVAVAAQRFGYLRYIPSATITAGAFTVDISENASDGGAKCYPSAFKVQ